MFRTTSQVEHVLVTKISAGLDNVVITSKALAPLIIEASSLNAGTIKYLELWPSLTPELSCTKRSPEEMAH